VRKAEADFRAAGKLERSNDRLHDQICFLSQQAAEKFLKALLEEIGLPVPRTHDLQDVSALLLPRYPSLSSLGRGLKLLTPFAVGTRYPGRNSSKRQARTAFRWAGKVRDDCRLLLGLRPPRKHRKKSS
jgi:HEPN domain-containing protein